MSNEYYYKLLSELNDRKRDISEQSLLESCVEKIIVNRCILNELNEMIDCVKRIIGLF